MSSRKLIQLISAGILIGGLAVTFGLFAQSVPTSYPQDNGPYKLDVSNYPKAVQKEYKVFKEKCSICHTLARPLNTTMSPAMWKEYVKYMLQKPGASAMINHQQAHEILEFLDYDQTHRKDKDPKKFYKPLTMKTVEAKEGVPKK
ncbi:MAG: hypothetical protein P8Z49_12245 [Acidobacteriota bacterium]